MGYTSIAQTPVVTGLYTVIFPTIVFALLGASRLLVVGADSATAAILAAGLGAAAIAGVTPNSEQWVAYTSFIALICGVLLRPRAGVPARVPGRLPVHVGADRVPHRCRGAGGHRPAPGHAGDPQGVGRLAGAAVAPAHVPRRHQRDNVGVRGRHPGHHRGLQAVRAEDPGRDRRGRAADHRVRGHRRVHARRGRRGIREQGLPADRSARRHRPATTGEPAPRSRSPASS